MRDYFYGDNSISSWHVLKMAQHIGTKLPLASRIFRKQPVDYTEWDCQTSLNLNKDTPVITMGFLPCIDRRYRL